jgi:hypothetical protein
LRLIPINPIPVQSFTFNFGGNRYDFTFRFNEGFVTYDIAIDEIGIISGFPFAIGALLIPYKYLEADGNFILSSEAGNQDADYTEFGDTQNLYYMSAEEAEAFRNEY